MEVKRINFHDNNNYFFIIIISLFRLNRVQEFEGPGTRMIFHDFSTVPLGGLRRFLAFEGAPQRGTSKKFPSI